MNAMHRRAIIHFTDASKLDLEWPKQDAQGHLFLSEAIRKAVQTERLLVEVGGNLLIIPMQNVKYVEVIPAPEQLPDGVVRNARYRVPPASQSNPPEDNS